MVIVKTRRAMAAMEAVTVQATAATEDTVLAMGKALPLLLKAPLQLLAHLVLEALASKITAHSGPSISSNTPNMLLITTPSSSSKQLQLRLEDPAIPLHHLQADLRVSGTMR